MAVLDFICRDCRYRVDNQGRIKCKREVARTLVCNAASMHRAISARSYGCISKDGMNCRYYEKRKQYENE